MGSVLIPRRERNVRNGAALARRVRSSSAKYISTRRPGLPSNQRSRIAASAIDRSRIGPVIPAEQLFYFELIYLSPRPLACDSVSTRGG